MRFKALIKNKWFILIAGIVLSVSVTAAILILFIINPIKKTNADQIVKIDTLNHELSTAKSDLDKSNEELTKAKSNLNSANQELNAIKSDLNAANQELDTIKNDLNAKQAELESINKEITKVKSDLTNSKSELEKAKRGVNHLKQLDPLFTSYDTKSNELSDILNKYTEAYYYGNYNDMLTYADQFDSKGQEVEEVYTNILTVLEDFRNGKY